MAITSKSKDLHWRHKPGGYEGTFDMMRAKTCPGCGKTIYVRDLKNIRPTAKNLRGER